MNNSEIFTEIRGLILRVVKWAIILLVLSLYFFTFSVQIKDFFGKKIPVPNISTDSSFAVNVFDMMRADIVPANVGLVVTSPFTAFVIQVKVSVFLAFIFSFPFILWSVLRYLSPALKDKEKRSIYFVVLPSTILFFAGCLFAYKLLIPKTISILYSYTNNLGVVTFFDISDFVSIAFGFMVVVGIMFLLPIVMFLSSAIGLIPHTFWKKQFRYAFLIVVIASAVLTPDGTGVTMVLLVIPLLLLYGCGMIMSKVFNLRV